MFIHNFKYMFKILFKNRMLIFWTYMFPIILGTFFYLAFSNIENSETLEVMHIAVVENEDFNNYAIYKNTIDSLSEDGSENQLFVTKYVSEEDAEQMLQKDEIVGYINFTDSPKIIIKENGIYETILKYIVEEIVQMEDIMANIIQSRIYISDIANYEEFLASITSEVAKIQSEYTANIKDISNSNLSYTMIEYYTLIAMACLYGGIIGMTAMNQTLANMSHTGKRVASSPVSKGKLILSSVCAGYLIQLIGVALLFLYTLFILKVDYGENLFFVLLLAFVGCLAGLSLGIVIASVLKKNEGTKIGIVISFTMLSCFFSGMMGITMKYIIDKNLPFLNKINPANMITDGFYSLYYYDTYSRYIFNVMSLLLFAILLIGISIFSLRRQKYDSI